MGENHKERRDLKVGDGYYVLAERVGNSYFLTRGDFQNDLYEVATERNINYQTGRKFNTCTHSVSMSDNGYLPASAAEFTSIRWRGHAEPGGDITAMEPYDSVKVGLKPSGSVSLRVSITDLENARYDGYNRLIHLNPGQLQSKATQAALELKDTENTLRQPLEFLQWARRMLGKKVKVGRGLLKPLTAASKLGDVASAYLWYKFGVEPTVQDVQAIRDDLLNGRLRVKGIKPKTYEKGQVVKAYYSAHPSRSDVLTAMFPHAKNGVFQISKEIEHVWTGYNTWSGDIIPNFVTDPLTCRKVVVEGSVRGCYFAEVKKTFTIDGLEQLRSKMAWNMPGFKTWWEVIPFSFLIDWVVDVGKYIERLERRYVNASYASNLGPVWGWEKMTTATYAPSIEHLAMRWENPRTLGRTSWAFNHCVWGTLSYFRSSSYSSFTRGLRSGQTGVNIPVLNRDIKAYQITTGMALLAQVGKSFAKGVL